MAAPLSLPPFEEVCEAITVKNTFVDWVTPTAASRRRCNSVPRSWMPEKNDMGSSCDKSVEVEGEDSTTASISSDKERFNSYGDLVSLAGSDRLTSYGDLVSLASSDNVFLPGASTPSSCSDFECQECDANSTVDSSGWSASSEQVTISKPTVKVRLLDFVGDAPEGKSASPVAQTKLRAAAQPFASVSTCTPPPGIQTVIQAAKDVLESDPTMVGVQMLKGEMGGTWTMVAHTNPNAPSKDPRHYLAAAKNAILTSAEHAQDIFLMGYGVKPFHKIDKYSFSATLASIPASQHKTACWDSYKNGFCPRQSICRWTHPCDTQTMRLVIRVHRACESSVNERNEKNEKSERNEKVEKKEKNEKSSHPAASTDLTEEFPGHLAMLQRCAMVLSGIATEIGAGRSIESLQSTLKKSEAVERCSKEFTWRHP